MLSRADVGDPAAVEEMVQFALGCFGRLDILVCNAGASDRIAFLHEWGGDPRERREAGDTKPGYALEGRRVDRLEESIFPLDRRCGSARYSRPTRGTRAGGAGTGRSD